MSYLLSKFDTPSIILGPISIAQPVFDRITLEVIDAVDYESPFPKYMIEVITMESGEVE